MGVHLYEHPLNTNKPLNYIHNILKKSKVSTERENEKAKKVAKKLCFVLTRAPPKMYFVQAAYEVIKLLFNVKHCLGYKK